MDFQSFTRRGITRLAAISLLTLGAMAPAWAALTITPITWNVVGLDSNSPLTGPYQFPVGARVCAIGTASSGIVTASFAFQSGGTNNGETACIGGDANPNAPADPLDACVFLRDDTFASYELDGDFATPGNQAIPAGVCRDAYFEVEVDRNGLAYQRARRYTITATDGLGSIVTPQPRELYVERLVSQNRNSVQNVSYSAALASADALPFPSTSLTSTSAGATFGLSVGGIYDIRLDASTATQGYEQLETFANFSNAVFRILKVHSTYSANTSPFYPITPPDAVTDLLYANACNWQLSPVFLNYLSCQGVGKTGGTISATYRIQVLTVPGGTNSALNTLIYDYSGSSFHYNADTDIGGRTIVIEDPLSAAFNKAFSPTSILQNGVSRLTLTITNPNLTSVSAYSFTDPLPSGIVVAATPGATTSGCGSPTFAPTAAATTLTFSNGTIAANATCTVAVNVTGAANGTYNNITTPLLVNGVSTGLTATASLTISDAPTIPLGTCPVGSPLTQLATINVGTATPNPPAATNNFPALINFVTPTFFSNNGGVGSINTSTTGSTSGVNSWQGYGFTANGGSTSAGPSYFQISVDTRNYRNLRLQFRGNPSSNPDWGSNNNNLYVYSQADGGAYVLTTFVPPNVGNPQAIAKTAWTTIIQDAPTSGATTTTFRIVPEGSSTIASGGTFLVDDVIISGCRVLLPPTATKAFAPSVIGVGQTTTLTFTISNPNTSALTGVNISDVLPGGLTINSLSTGTCGGTLTQSPAGTINLSAVSLAASASCSFSANITGTTAGLKQNVSGFVGSSESGPSTSSSGRATADLRVVAPPSISKAFTNTPIASGTDSALRFTITNPNAVYSMVNVGFTDTFPVSPGAMVVAPTPGATNGCGGTWTPVAGAGSVSLSGVTLGPSASCSVSVYVRAPAAGTYNNTSDAVSHVINAATLSGNTAIASLVANAPVAGIGLQKRVGLSATGPWGEFVGVAPSTPIFFQFTMENTGDVVLSRPASGFWITDSLIPGGPFCAGPASLTLPTITDTHIYECVVAATASASVGTFLNTGTATGTPPTGPDVTATNTASYSTKLPDLSVSKLRVVSVADPTPTAVPIDNSSTTVDVTYRIRITNNSPDTTYSSTLAPIVIEDTLLAGITYLSFSANSDWSCGVVQTAPPPPLRDKVTCSYSNALASGAFTDVLLVVRVGVGTPRIDNTAVVLNGGDPDCVNTDPNSGTGCKGPYIEGTVPVTLSDVGVTVENGQLVVDFGTAAEAGTLGFRVLGGLPGDRAKLPINDALTVAKGSGFEPRRYEVRGPYTGQTQVWIEEITTDGKTERYGPYAVGTQTGERQLMVPTDWSAIAAEQDGFRQTQVSAVLGRSSGGSIEAELRVAATGLVRVSHEDLLAQGINWSGTSSSQIRLSNGSEAVPMRYEGPATFGTGSALYFFGEAVSDSQYTKTTVYRLSVSNRGAAAMRTIYSGIGDKLAATSVRDTLVHNPNRTYDLASAHTDPWYAQRVVRVNAPLAGINESFVVPDRSEGSARERIEIGMWGGMSFAASPDHSVRLLLNGTQIATRQFDGRAYELVSVDLPQGLLTNGNNTLRVELVGDTGVYADLVYLDSIRVHYTRDLKAINNRLAFVADAPGSAPRTMSDRIHADDFSTDGIAACESSDDGCVSYQIRGLTRADVGVFRARSDGGVEQLTGTRIAGVSGNYELSFSTQQVAGDRYWIEPVVGSVTTAIAPRAAITDPLAGGPAEYLVISHPSFIAGLPPLIAARQAEGFSVRVVDVEDLYAFYNRGTVDPVAIGTAIADAYSRLGTRYVLLVGGDTYDYFNYTGVNSRSFVPTNYRATGPIIRFAPVDSPYADVDLDGVADVAIGRFPVRTLPELSATITKTLAYSQAPHGRKMLRIADRTAQDTVGYASQLTTLNGLLGPSTMATDLWLDNYPGGNLGITQARADMVSAVNSGQALVAFFGHSSPSSWATDSLLTAAQVNAGLFNNASLPTVAWVLGCYGSYFTSPTYNTVAAALMVQMNGGGAAAVLGTSGLTNINSDLAWMNALKPHLGTQRIGDAVRAGQETLQNAGPDYIDITVGGTLLGDPALRVRR